jgi:hypothetical protein
MAIGRYQAELPHSPRLVAEGLAYLGASGLHRVTKRVNSCDLKVGKIGMIAELEW